MCTLNKINWTSSQTSIEVKVCSIFHYFIAITTCVLSEGLCLTKACYTDLSALIRQVAGRYQPVGQTKTSRDFKVIKTLSTFHSTNILIKSTSLTQLCLSLTTFGENFLINYAMVEVWGEVNMQLLGHQNVSIFYNHFMHYLYIDILREKIN